MVGLLAGAASGCSEDARDGGAQLLLPNDFEIHWDASYNGVDDGLGALVPVDVMAYEGSSGAPLEAVEVFVQADYDGATLVDADGFRIVDPAECVDPVDGGHGWGAACAARYDAEHDEYIEFRSARAAAREFTSARAAGEFTSGRAAAGEFDQSEQTGIQLRTDADGLARVYVFVDAFPPAAENGVSVWVSMRVPSTRGARLTDGSFRLLPR